MMYSCAPASASSRAAIKKRGKSLRVDIHCHYLNTQVAEKVTPLNPAQHEPMAVYSNAATRAANVNQGKERGAKLTDIALRLKEMDKMGVDIQAVSPAPHQTYYWTDPGMGQELSRQINERLAEIVAQHPDRFVALGTIPLQDVSLAVSELSHCVKTLGMRGVEINPSVRGMDLTDAKLNLEAFFAKADLVICDTMYSLGDTVSLKQDWGHSSNVVAVDLCHGARAKRLVLFHHEPTYTDEDIQRMHGETIRYEELVRGESPPLEVICAYDGLAVTV